jgi:hypothetical protein
MVNWPKFGLGKKQDTSGEALLTGNEAVQYLASNFTWHPTHSGHPGIAASEVTEEKLRPLFKRDDNVSTVRTTLMAETAPVDNSTSLGGVAAHYACIPHPRGVTALRDCPPSGLAAAIRANPDYAAREEAFNAEHKKPEPVAAENPPRGEQALSRDDVRKRLSELGWQPTRSNRPGIRDELVDDAALAALFPNPADVALAQDIRHTEMSHANVSASLGGPGYYAVTSSPHRPDAPPVNINSLPLSPLGEVVARSEAYRLRRSAPAIGALLARAQAGHALAAAAPDLPKDPEHAMNADEMRRHLAQLEWLPTTSGQPGIRSRELSDVTLERMFEMAENRALAAQIRNTEMQAMSTSGSVGGPSFYVKPESPLAGIIATTNQRYRTRAQAKGQQLPEAQAPGELQRMPPIEIIIQRGPVPPATGQEMKEQGDAKQGGGLAGGAPGNA